jgi:hypothetical protein
MAVFGDALKSIADGIKDLSSLEVISFKGTINLATAGNLTKFDDMFTSAKASADFKVLAMTKSFLDGDTLSFVDDSISDAEREAHHLLLEGALTKRAEVIKMFENLIVTGAKPG